MRLALLLPAIALAACPGGAPAKADVETILFIRHAEKPARGLGQLSCKGLNRALALGPMLAKRYGRIDAVFAPDPSHQKEDGEAAYDYVRPLATVEPTAIRFELPIHASLGYKKTDELAQALAAPEFHGATVLVAWEHHKLGTMVPALVKSLGGDAGAVAPWAREDFDTIWKVTVTRENGATRAAFAREQQGLDGLPETCPG